MSVKVEESLDLISLLSEVMFAHVPERCDAPVVDQQTLDWRELSRWPNEHLIALRKTADTHHVLVRALQVLRQKTLGPGNEKLSDWCDELLAWERGRISHAVEVLAEICEALESAGIPVAVIKSLDHWPDLGSDLDLYTDRDPQLVVGVMRDRFKAAPEPRSWGDRLAGKWNFKVPGLPELVEVHVCRLGQTGEQKSLARRVLERRAKKTVNGFTFHVPACEERVLIATLQRMYRHFYFRLCDIVDFVAPLQGGRIDFMELMSAAEGGSIWPGVATFLFLVSQYASKYGTSVSVPEEVLAALPSQDISLHSEGGLLRIPRSSAANLFRSELLGAGRAGDLRAALRLSLLPPLAVSAFVAFRLTGNDKGIW